MSALPVIMEVATNPALATALVVSAYARFILPCTVAVVALIATTTRNEHCRRAALRALTILLGRSERS
ncbi:hypothetical protein [Streptomyces sp. NEAU-H3]|uniref:hypothetical protein n=1 Tax=Streptomyces sp. NEAU-H3 TaxID=2720636 RepID=UPI00143B2C58|nr:hypothetical protein [Streptomyces sp. NEAU-H3]NJA59220.1 hypothetical protein [Streptomyces sp. NEAU-H3]